MQKNNLLRKKYRLLTKKSNQFVKKYTPYFQKTQQLQGFSKKKHIKLHLFQVKTLYKPFLKNLLHYSIVNSKKVSGKKIVSIFL